MGKNLAATVSPPAETPPRDDWLKALAAPAKPQDDDGSDLAAAEFAEFNALLEQSTPRAWVVPSLVAANAIVFIAMVVSGVDIFTPTTESFLDWGANYGPKTLGGQPLRLVASTFLHFGIFHLGFNMIALLSVGTLVERLFGHARFATLYLVAGLAGSVASLVAHPQIVSAGASGAVFGVYGALAGFLVRQRGVMPPLVLKGLLKVALCFIGYNLLAGFGKSGIDNAAHLGGLVAGAACGAFLARPLVGGSGAARDLGRPGVALSAGLLLAFAAVVLLPKPLDYLAELNGLAAAERSAIDTYNRLYERASRISAADYASELEKEILPPWRRARARLAAQQSSWPAPQKKLVDTLLRYADARERGWRDLAKALRTDDQTAAEAAQSNQDEAEKLLEELKRWKTE
ncbi:MAG: rhomboid family intramembrane serine protease [Gammaproteobacteria bacterium]